MFKTQKSLLITGLVAYVLYIFVFGIIFGPLEFSWAFYILAAMMGFAFYAMVSDYYPQTEAMEMTESPSDSARYIEDPAYARASICAILILLLSITPLLITVSLNQRGVADISWFWQALIFLGGYTLQFITLSIYKGCDPISIQGHLWYAGLGTRSSSLTREEVFEQIDRVTEVSISQKDRDEAKKIVDDIIVRILAIDRSEITDGVRMEYLGTDELDCFDIIEAIDEYLKQKYGYTTKNIKHSYRESSLMKRYIDFNDRKNADKLSDIFLTVRDYYDLIAESIFYIRKNLK